MAAPKEPTGLWPYSGMAISRTENIYFKWVFNEGAAGETQTGWQWRCQFIGENGTVLYDTTRGNNASNGGRWYRYTLFPGFFNETTDATTMVRWTVRTQVGDDWGPWAEWQVVAVDYGPIVHIEAEQTADSSEYLVAFEVENADEFVSTSLTVESEAVKPPEVVKVTETSYRLFGLERGNVYTISVTAFNGHLEGTGTCTLTAGYAEVAPPVLSFEHVPSVGAVDITVTRGSGGTTATYYVVERSIDDGQSWQTVASYVNAGETVRDYSCSVTGRNLYQAWGVKEGA